MSRRLELDDLYRLPFCSDPRLSPDGSRVAFVVTTADRDKDCNRSSIWMVAADGSSSARQLTFGERDSAPRWSPDGRWLAFVAARGDKPKPQVWLLPDTTQVTRGDYSVGAPAWSPDDTTIAFAAAMHEDRDLDLASHVFLVDAAGKEEPTALTKGRSVAAAPTFSPDGRTVLYAGAPHTGVGHARLFSVAVDGGEPAEMAPGLDRNVMIGGPGYPGAPPRFSRDGTAVLFCARDQGSTHIYRAPVDGEATKIVGDEWTSAAGLSLSADGGSMAYVLSTPESCGDVWLARSDGIGPTQLTHLVADALEGIDMFRPEARQFDAPDGTAIHGWVLRDPSTTAAGPLLLDVHGGPHNAWNPIFDGVHLYHQVLVSRGWSVLFINPRGSDGYGESFYTGLLAAGWGRSDTDDFLGAVDALIDEGVADRSRVAVTGYSYGGYMTCWLTATTDRFAAAVAGGVVSDLTSFSGTSDIGAGFARVEIGAMPWEDAERLSALSPFTYVEGVHAPTLIVHGENDDRCPIGQAEEWFSALRVHGVETELVRYPGASHLFILSGPPSQRVDWCDRIIEWVEAHT